MGMLGGSFGNIPGMTDTSPYLTYENAFGWGGFPKLALIISRELDSTTADPGASPTWRLRPGLVLGPINATGNLKQYDPTATDGSAIATAVLIEGMRMQDVFSGSNVAKFMGVMVSGPVRASALYGLDQKARRDMRAAGFVFDDDTRGSFPWRVQEGAFGNVTTVIPTPGAGALYQNGTHFIVTTGAGTATFTLPAVGPGLYYKFSSIMAQTLTVQRGGADVIVSFNNAAATSVAFSTGGSQIGAALEAQTFYNSASGTYQWLVTDASSAAITVT